MRLKQKKKREKKKRMSESRKNDNNKNDSRYHTLTHTHGRFPTILF